MRSRALILVIHFIFEKPMNQQSKTPQLSSRAAASRMRVAIISAQWHADIVHCARDAAVAVIKKTGVAKKDIVLFDVPGAFEIPLHAQRLADTGNFDAIIACALVVDGGIYRHDFVATAVIDGLMRVQLDTAIPIFSAVLTPHHFHDTPEHHAFFTAHFVKKGEEVAHACLQTVVALQGLE
jgi:6,7-dimethyl-8-ribityllumazine synthase